MGSTSLSDRYTYRLDDSRPFLSVHNVPFFVRDQERSLRFYVDGLGFEVLIDHTFPNGDRFVAVAPPDGAVFLGLVSPKVDHALHALIEEPQRVNLVTENVEATYAEWSGRGVQFEHAPITGIHLSARKISSQ